MLIVSIRKYGLIGFFKLVVSILTSRLLYGRKIRVMRSLPRLVKVGLIQFGENFTSGKDLRLESITKNSKLIFGNNVKINDYCHIGAIDEVIVSDGCLIGSRVTIIDHDHGRYDTESRDINTSPHDLPDERVLFSKPIFIGRNVWIAEGVVILPGTKIGEGCVIGANSVVKGDIPAFSIAVGLPAKVIKIYNEETGLWEKK